MKQGSTDDPFADEPATDSGKSEESNAEQSEISDEASSVLDDERSQTPTDQSRSLPFIHSRDGVKDGRTQRPVFLRDHVEQGIDDLLNRMETELDEDVYKTDVTEASMVIAQEHPELVLAKLEEWGYGWE